MHSRHFEGGYGHIAPTIFAHETVDGFFLEYDDDRSGDFQPLTYIPEGGARVVLGVVTSKSGELGIRRPLNPAFTRRQTMYL